ncbi:MAG: hypothetical protein NDJ92_17995 [Thermoanaerobaculia bacterium]|nr:hypothetical protein [Thermoanaerobaculia bacterium]
MDRFEAVERAARAYGLTSDHIPVTHLAERDGQHLVFVNAFTGGAYLVIHATGTVREVGDSDQGITTSWVPQYFGLGRPYASRT